MGLMKTNTIAETNDNQDPWRHMASLDPNELMATTVI